MAFFLPIFYTKLVVFENKGWKIQIEKFYKARKRETENIFLKFEEKGRGQLDEKWKA